MHYATLATVEIPHIKEEDELNVIITVAENALEAQSDSDFMNEYFLCGQQSSGRGYGSVL